MAKLFFFVSFGSLELVIVSLFFLFKYDIPIIASSQTPIGHYFSIVNASNSASPFFKRYLSLTFAPSLIQGYFLSGLL